jgi:hypothetical protein
MFCFWTSDPKGKRRYLVMIRGYHTELLSFSSNYSEAAPFFRRTGTLAYPLIRCANGKPRMGAIRHDKKGIAVLAPEIELLLRIIDEGYNKKAWHGPNLRGAIKRVEFAQAAWRPAPERHNVWEHVVHAAYWKYIVRRRLRGEKKG